MSVLVVFVSIYHESMCRVYLCVCLDVGDVRVYVAHKSPCRTPTENACTIYLSMGGI